ncbi:unnamed protein product [Meloidogyne enterolobii]|uniref:Uncharacterized protein n=1 Tax=Meloidogyne enterolobii TaxID=390850 RepID=A0ACB1ARI5_MELEN
MPAPAMVCNPASCQPGYTCGHYGCARNKARSALTKKVKIGKILKYLCCFPPLCRFPPPPSFLRLISLY